MVVYSNHAPWILIKMEFQILTNSCRHSIMIRVQGFLQDFITIRLKLIASNFHTPKPTICITSMGSCQNFHTPKLKFLRNRTPKGASRAPR